MKIYKDEIDSPLEPLIQSGVDRYITVFLIPYKTGDKRNFRCVNCGKIVFQYESEVGLIIDSSETPRGKAPIDAMCHRCKLIYRILW